MEVKSRKRLYMTWLALGLQVISLSTPWLFVMQAGSSHSYSALKLVSTTIAAILLAVVAFLTSLIESSRSRRWHYSAVVFGLCLCISVGVVISIEIGSSLTPKLLVPAAFQRAWFAVGAGFGGWIYVAGSLIGLAASIIPRRRGKKFDLYVNAWKYRSNQRIGLMLIGLAAISAFTCRYLYWFSIGNGSGAIEPGP